MTSTALAAGAVVMHPFDAFAQPSAAQGALIARAKSLELDTPYVPPPGDGLEHHAAGFAKIMCSAVFVTGLDPDFAAENVGYFTAPYEVRGKLGKPAIDRVEKAVHVTLPNGVTRTAKYLGSQGCVTFPIGRESVIFTPVGVVSRLPDPSTQPWPMGDVLRDDPLPPEIDATKLKQAVDAAFNPPAGMTAAFVVTWRGRLIAERYGNGITARTPLEGWSMGKSLTATLMGVLIKQGVYDIWQPAPIRNGRAPAIRAQKFASATSCVCRAGCASVRRRIPITIRRDPIPIISTCIRAASIRSITPLPGRCNGRPTRSAVTATPIRS